MEKLVISGGKPLTGTVTVAGAKNVAMKVILAGLLTDETLVINNVPLISSVLGTAKIVELLGVKIEKTNHTLNIKSDNLHKYEIPLELGGLYRTAPMAMGPLLARLGKAVVPNPGGCRLGKRPINRHIEALTQMGAEIKYKDGFFYGEGKLHGANIIFPKNTHTGTETLILAAVLAKGITVLENAAQEPEVDDLIKLLTQMGAKIFRNNRTLKIEGVKELHGTEFSVMPDRNEVVTYAVVAAATKGNITVNGVEEEYLNVFFEKLKQAGVGIQKIENRTYRFFYNGELKSTDVTTGAHPQFMTDWQAPWAVLMTQARGQSSIHETVFESRFSYVEELKKMGCKIEYFNPEIKSPEKTYNFDWHEQLVGNFQGIKIFGPTTLHNGVVQITDLRAGATLVIAALVAQGESVLLGVEHIDRGYERFDEQLTSLGAQISRQKEEEDI